MLQVFHGLLAFFSKEEGKGEEQNNRKDLFPLFKTLMA
jgi:hypothetical protein